MDHSENRLLLLLLFIGIICFGLKSLIDKVPQLDIESLEKNVSVKSNISFEESDYKCMVGDHIYTTITADDSSTNVKTFSSDDIAIATITLSDQQPNCSNCIGVNIICRGVGTTYVRAISRNEDTTDSLVTVSIPNKKSS